MFNILKENLDMPIVYNTFKEPISPPFIILRNAAPDLYYADNINYYIEDNYTLEFYFKFKDIEAERSLENLLTANEYRWVKSEDIPINEEGLIAIYYEVYP